MYEQTRQQSEKRRIEQKMETVFEPTGLGVNDE